MSFEWKKLVFAQGVGTSRVLSLSARVLVGPPSLFSTGTFLCPMKFPSEAVGFPSSSPPTRLGFWHRRRPPVKPSFTTPTLALATHIRPLQLAHRRGPCSSCATAHPWSPVAAPWSSHWPLLWFPTA
jgi:hypothetical protein